MRPPFACLHKISERVRCKREVGTDKTKASEVSLAGFCSDWMIDCGSGRSRTAVPHMPLCARLSRLSQCAFALLTEQHTGSKPIHSPELQFITENVKSSLEVLRGQITFYTNTRSFSKPWRSASFRLAVYNTAAGCLGDR